MRCGAVLYDGNGQGVGESKKKKNWLVRGKVFDRCASGGGVGREGLQMVLAI